MLTDTAVNADKGGWMQTFTGRAFTPMNPNLDEIDILDIAGSLSKMCRFGGHCLRFYSVAEHCVHLARRAPDMFRLTALMHDASEAYLVDIPRPLKPFLPGYYESEDRLMRAIAQKFGFFWPLPAEVKRLDQAILSDEREQNMRHMDVPPEQWGNALPALGVELEFWSPAQSANEFIKSFHLYGGQL